jgi:DNA-binding beta-propeller fold protein YncE
MKTSKITFIISLVTIITSSGCDEIISTNAQEKSAVKTYQLLGDKATPEGISIDQRNGYIYTGGMQDGSMQVTINGKSSYFIEPESGILLPNVLGSAIDEKHNRIWVCSNDFSKTFSGKPTARVSVINIKDGKLIKQFSETDLTSSTAGVFAFVNDVILDKAGSAYVANSGSNTIFKIDANLEQVKVLANKFPSPPAGKKYSLNGIEISENEQFLIANTFILAEADAAALFRINIATGEVDEIAFEEKETTDFSKSGGDGLLMIDKNTLLCMSVSSTVLRIDLDKELTKATITNISTGTKAQEHLVGSATLASFKKNIYTTNAQGLALFNPNVIAQKPYKIIEIPKSIVGL